jgi:uncharacterized membrane protein YcaP (DUF421 family)
MFFNGWEAVVRVVIMGTISYIALIILLRTSGKRTLSKMNMFDFVITVALGSTYSTLILSKDIALAEGVVGLGLLILLQYIVAWFSVRSKRFQQLVKGEPSLLFYRGGYLEDTMRAERISGEEVRSAARKQGLSSMTEVGAVILETDGTFSVIPQLHPSTSTALEDVDLPKSD